MPDDRDVFAALTALVLEQRASPAELVRFRELLRAHPEFIESYRSQVMIATLLPALSLWEQTPEHPCAADDAPAVSEEDACQTSVPPRGVAWWLRAVAAAAVMALLAGVAARLGIRGVGRGGMAQIPAAMSISPVQVISQALAQGLQLPLALPGTLKLADGQAKVCLSSGVELTLLGPLELEVRNAMEARLSKGRLLAWVPPRASGFTVHAPGLTVWDIGTVFSVATLDQVSDVFVFKGRVQVTEAEGDAVGLCEAGEGARARAGSGAMKTAADWSEAQQLFASVAGRLAVENPVAALSTAGRIADLWEARYLPTVVPPPVPGLRGGVRTEDRGRRTEDGGQRTEDGGQRPAGSRQPGSGVLGPGSETISSTITAANGPPAKQEGAQMKATNTVVALAAATVLGAAGAAWAVPEVTGVTMTQLANSRIVDIGYTLAGEAAMPGLAGVAQAFLRGRPDESSESMESIDPNHSILSIHSKNQRFSLRKQTYGQN